MSVDIHSTTVCVTDTPRLFYLTYSTGSQDCIHMMVVLVIGEVCLLLVVVLVLAEQLGMRTVVMLLALLCCS